ncbi:MAG: tryptophan synthase subunit alpha [Actinomycetota bacterium]|nr:tryptophan synthase subunit alpha [Actinomycetota bacterium]
MGNLEATLRAVRDRGAKSFVPYVTGGYPGVGGEFLRMLAAAGADAIEVGIPHSDPIMDGGVIQEASRVALERGTRLGDVLASVADAAIDVPVAVMTYANIVHHRGYEVFCDDLARSGVAGAIVPDLPVDEAERFAGLGAARGIDVVLLAAPGATALRYEAIAASSHGFVYCVATFGVTGVRDQLSVTAREVVTALRPHTDLPLLVGVGIATPEQAREASTFADGVIVGSALMAPLVAGDPTAALQLAEAFRSEM